MHPLLFTVYSIASLRQSTLVELRFIRRLLAIHFFFFFERIISFLITGDIVFEEWGLLGC